MHTIQHNTSLGFALKRDKSLSSNIFSVAA
jgi:hypothetical protein